jgi:hypothetical protein
MTDFRLDTQIDSDTFLQFLDEIPINQAYFKKKYNEKSNFVYR